MQVVQPALWCDPLLGFQVSAPRRPSPGDVVAVVSALTGISLDTLQSPSQARKLGRVRAAAAHLLRVDSGLGLKQVAPFLGRSDQTVCDFSRKARVALDNGGDIAELIDKARHVLDDGLHHVPTDTAEQHARLAALRRQPKPRAFAVPHLRAWRVRTGLDQAQLAERAGIARETIARVENGRPARLDSILQLADALMLAPSELTGSPDLGALASDVYRTCKDCAARRPLRRFLEVKGTPYFYLRCRTCRAKRARERYHGDPRERTKQIQRARRNNAKRRQRSAEASSDLTVAVAG